MHEWLSLLASRSVVKRAFKYALVVGFVLIAINHGDALLKGDLTPRRISKMLLTVCVPYVVSSLSSVGALREKKKALST